MGHRAPYLAVITLSVLTAHHWRSIRTKLLLAGVSDPMGLRTMHMLLDTTEAAVLEAMSLEHGKDADMKRTMFLDKLYSPLSDPGGLNDDDYAGQPSGFQDDEVEASFDAFMAAAR